MRSFARWTSRTSSVSLEAIAKGRQHLERRNADGEVMAKFEAGMFDISRSPWSRLGAFDPADRSHALDVLGFEAQLVFSTFSFTRSPIRLIRRPLRSGPASTTGRWVDSVPTTIGCSQGVCPAVLGPEVAGELLDEAFADGCFTVMVDTNEADPEARSFTHPTSIRYGLVSLHATCPSSCTSP